MALGGHELFVLVILLHFDSHVSSCFYFFHFLFRKKRRKELGWLELGRVKGRVDGLGMDS